MGLEWRLGATLVWPSPEVASEFDLGSLLVARHPVYTS